MNLIKKQRKAAAKIARISNESGVAVAIFTVEDALSAIRRQQIGLDLDKGTLIDIADECIDHVFEESLVETGSTLLDNAVWDAIASRK